MPESPAGPGSLRVAFKTLGCKVNRVEADEIAAGLLGSGAVLAPEEEAAVVVVTTCTVTGEADAKARKAVRHALGAGRSPLVVVTGCLASLDAAGLESFGERVIVEPDKSRVASRVAHALGLVDEPHADPELAAGEGFRTRVAVKIEDGCDNFCSYCIVPYARGVPTAVPLGAVVARVRALVDSGTREVVLTGINIGRYRDGEAELRHVIEAVGATGIDRIRLSSIEPPDLTPQLLETLASTPAVCEHLHVPLQSGDSEVLSAMGRKYTAEQFGEWIARARTAMPGLAVTTDVIAGFPGETQQQHEHTLEFVSELDFTKLHVFRYSARPGTPAAAMAQVEPRVRALRATELRELGDASRARHIAARSGQRAEVLVERVEAGRATGTTRDYLRVSFDASAGVEVGDLTHVDLIGSDCA